VADEATDAGIARRKVSDADQAIRALEESASYRKREAARAARSLEDLGLSAPAPAPRPAPPLTPVPTGEVTLAFEHLKAGAIPRAPEPEPPAPPPPVPLSESSAPKSIPTAGQPMQESIAALGSTPMAPPVGFVPRSRAGRPADDNQRAVDDAKRLARLLVSEIKLYNERKVEEGRAAGDLYERLRDDIQRSRQVYEERTPDSVRLSGDFFHEELIRILAEGRAESLGPAN
jgi:hypothetical protein